MTAQLSKLRTSNHNRMIGGVCGGLEEFTGINAWWFRMFFLLTAIPGGIPGITLYILAWIMMPKA